MRLAGEPELGVVDLNSAHEFAKAGNIGFWKFVARYRRDRLRRTWQRLQHRDETQPGRRSSDERHCESFHGAISCCSLMELVARLLGLRIELEPARLFLVPHVASCHFPTWCTLEPGHHRSRALETRSAGAPARAVRSAGSAYLPTCGFQKFLPVGFARPGRNHKSSKSSGTRDGAQSPGVALLTP